MHKYIIWNITGHIHFGSSNCIQNNFYKLNKFGFNKHTVSAKIDEIRNLPLTVANDIFLDCSALSRFEFKFTPYLSFDAANFPFQCTISINWMKHLLQQESLYISNAVMKQAEYWLEATVENVS
ncbi:hypothetical protein Tsp_08791 [Trichinella spiralis]|uniref:hypothetical protein n=1 Tax=Trichinella spiralis TaxID=6334 RepID=UPI0001EFE4D7|nr:hypothetical protein Tsp_08791 [Trichinella spiralis]